MPPTYLALARLTQRSTLRDLAYLGGATDCDSAPWISYRRSDEEPQWCDLWYVTTQVAADVALLAADPAFGRCTVDKAGLFLDRFWDDHSIGYLARGHPDGSRFLRPDKFCDDHGHLGLVMLAAWRQTGDDAWLQRARRAADFLLQADVWDDTFGGGFWWSTLRGSMLEGKPAQANGLAMALFLELYAATGQRHYLSWADRTADWLESHLYDPAAGLYRWGIHHADLDRRRGQVLDERFFNYDQAIILEAHLARYRHVESNPALLDRARSLAARLERAFWADEVGGFTLVSGVPDVQAIYAAWLTPALLALHRRDPDPRWLALARRNAEALHAALRAPGGGYYRAIRRVGPHWTVDTVRDQVANAGMQWAFAHLALAERDERTGRDRPG